jgi:hypothetical protein
MFIYPISENTAVSCLAEAKVAARKETVKPRHCGGVAGDIHKVYSISYCPRYTLYAYNSMTQVSLQFRARFRSLRYVLLAAAFVQMESPRSNSKVC